MKETNDIHNLLSKYLAGETDEQENEKLYHWLTDSPEHMQEFIRHKQTWDNITLAQTSQIDAQAVYRDLKKKIQRSHHSKHRFITLAGIAASLLILLGITFLLDQTSENRSSYNSRITTTRAEQKKIVLPDQTIVWLNSESQLSYNTQKSGCREVLLSGEAFFEVAKDTLHPFIVKTQNINIKVLGTKFNVNSYEGNNKIETTVIEGHVAVSSRKNIAGREKLHLLANDQATFSKNDQKFNLTKVDANAYSLWTQGQLCFKEEALPEIIKILERHFNIDITLNDETLKEYIFTATFEKDKSIKEILEVFKLTSPMDYSLTGKQITIYLKNE